jgi:hypothetical protein
MRTLALVLCLGCIGASGLAHARSDSSACRTDKTDKAAKAAKKAKNLAKRKKAAPATEEAKVETPTVAKAPPAINHALPTGLGPPPPLPSKYTAVAVLPFSGVDVGFELSRSVEHALLSEIDEHSPMQAVSPQDVLSDLHTFNLDLAKCEGDAECLAEMARYARVHAAIDVQLAFVSGTLSLSLRLLDTQTGTQTTAVADTLSDDPQARAEEIHRLAVQLLAPDTYAGSLTLVVPESGTDVYLDDKLVGTSPLPGAFDQLHAGPHVLRLTKPGFADLYQFVDVIYNRNSTVTVDLRSNTISGAIVAVESKTGLGLLYVVCSSLDIEIRVDGEPRGSTVLSAAIDNVPAGKRRISFRASDLPAEVREVSIEANHRTDIIVTKTDNGLEIGNISIVDPSTPLPGTAASTVASAPPASPKSFSLWQPDWRTRSGLIGGIAGVLSLGASAYFANQVRTTNAERDSIFAQIKNGASAKQWQTLNNKLNNDINPRGQRAELWQWITLGCGVALVGGGTWMVVHSALHPLAETAVAADSSPNAQFGFGLGSLHARLDW